MPRSPLPTRARVVDGEAKCMKTAGTNFPTLPQPRLSHFWVPMEGNPAVRHIWVDFAEVAMSAALTIL